MITIDLAEARFHRDVIRLHNLGPRPLLEMLRELGEARLIRTEIERLPGNQTLEAEGAIQAPSGGVLAAAFGGSFEANDIPRMVRAQARMQADTGIVPDPDTPIQIAPDPQLDPATLNERFGIKGQLNFDQPMTEFSARDLYEHKRDELLRQDTIARRSNSILTGGVARFGVGLVASLLDPLNIAAPLIPVVGKRR